MTNYRTKTISLTLAVALSLGSLSACASTTAASTASISEPADPVEATVTVTALSLDGATVKLPDGTEFTIPADELPDINDLSLGDEITIEYTQNEDGSYSAVVTEEEAPADETEDESESASESEPTTESEPVSEEEAKAEEKTADESSKQAQSASTQSSTSAATSAASTSTATSKASESAATETSKVSSKASETAAASKTSGAAKTEESTNSSDDFINFITSHTFTNDDGDTLTLTDGGESESEDEPETEDGEYSSKVYEAIDLINEERVKAGLDELEIDDELMELADIRADEIKENFSHTRPDGTRLALTHHCWENIAGGFRTAEKCVEAWMDSEGHRGNILEERITRIGVGYSGFWVMLASD